MLRGKKIIIGITGSIAAYKVPYLIRMLKREGAEVQVLVTSMAKDFVTPLTLSALSEKPVYSEYFDKGDGTWTSHVSLGLWADLFLFAPASANTMGKMSSGIADNLLLTTYLSARCPVFIAPAMDLDMYKHPSTKKSIDILKSQGCRFIDPVEGELASGLKGCGRMEEPEVIFEHIKNHFLTSVTFKGKRVLVTAGPTHEPVDPVRFIGNSSSGKMGIEIAKALDNLGAEVDLVLGPVSQKVDSDSVNVINVKTADDMHQACVSVFDEADITIMAAAVADFTPEVVSDQKIKKQTGFESINLVPTVDILSELGKKKRENQLLIGFALETENERDNALTKLHNKNCDAIVLNSLNDMGAGFGYDTNKVTFITRNGEEIITGLKSKQEIASDLIRVLDRLLKS